MENAYRRAGPQLLALGSRFNAVAALVMTPYRYILSESPHFVLWLFAGAAHSLVFLRRLGLLTLRLVGQRRFRLKRVLVLHLAG